MIKELKAQANHLWTLLWFAPLLIFVAVFYVNVLIPHYQECMLTASFWECSHWLIR